MDISSEVLDDGCVRKSVPLDWAKRWLLRNELDKKIKWNKLEIKTKKKEKIRRRE